jgi:hypothetical protein
MLMLAKKSERVIDSIPMRRQGGYQVTRMIHSVGNYYSEGVWRMFSHETALSIVCVVLVVFVGIRFAVSEVLAIIDSIEEWWERRARRKAQLSPVDISLDKTKISSSIAAPTPKTHLRGTRNHNRRNTKASRIRSLVENAPPLAVDGELYALARHGTDKSLDPAAERERPLHEGDDACVPHANQ